MMAFNYPNHPLFRIAPMLDRGFNRVDHDEYTSRLVGRIRAGRYTPELWDCNSLILGYGERSGPVYRNQTAFKSRYSMTAQELQDYRNSPEAKADRARMAAEREAKKAQLFAEETALAARRREAAEERQRVGREIEERLAKRKAEKEQQDREWAEHEAVAQVKRTEQAAALVAAELARRSAEYEAAKARQEQRYAERALRRVSEELAKPTPNQELLAIFARWLDAPKDRLNPQNPG
jgi:hypothetical protein